MATEDLENNKGNSGTEHPDKNKGAYTSVLPNASSPTLVPEAATSVLHGQQTLVRKHPSQSPNGPIQANTIERCSGVIASIATAIAINWFSGPYIAVAARELYEWLCNHLFGNYQWYDPRFYTIHVPAREHVSHFGYVYGPFIVGTLMLPLVYKGFNKCWRWMHSCWTAFRGSSEQTDPFIQAISEEALLQAIDSLRMKLEKLSLEESVVKAKPHSQSSPTLLLSSKHKYSTPFEGKNLTKSTSSPALLHTEMLSDTVYPLSKETQNDDFSQMSTKPQHLSKKT